MKAITGNPIRAVELQSEMTPEEWRGKCLDLFARHELAVISTLEDARASDGKQSIPHLAGQRTATLDKLVGALELTDRQSSSWDAARSQWQNFEKRRVLLAHGILTAAYEPQGCWLILLDVKVYRANIGSSDRWALRQSEAQDFLCALKKAKDASCTQLGQLRKILQIRAA